MKITYQILSVQGEKNAEIALESELRTTFSDSPVKCYLAASMAEKAAKNVKKQFVAPERLEQLIEKYADAVANQKHFREEGVDCFIREKKTYEYTGEKFAQLTQRLQRAKDALDKLKKQQEESGEAILTSTSYTFECHGEK